MKSLNKKEQPPAERNRRLNQPNLRLNSKQIKKTSQQITIAVNRKAAGFIPYVPLPVAGGKKLENSLKTVKSEAKSRNNRHTDQKFSPNCGKILNSVDNAEQFR